MEANRRFLLAKPADWDTWLGYVRARASNHYVWDLVNPDLPTKPATIEKPTIPELEVVEGADLPTRQLAVETLRINEKLYAHKVAAFRDQQKAFQDLTNFIQETVALNYSKYMPKEASNPWDTLHALKIRISPTGTARKFEIIKRWNNIIKGPGNHQNTEAWIDEFDTIYTEGKKLEVMEMGDPKSIITSFLLAVGNKDPAFTQFHLHRLSLDETLEIRDIVDGFREKVKLQASRDDKPAFVAEAHAASTSQDQTTSFRGRKQSPKPCLCGTTHWYPQCFYLNPSIRPNTWAPDQMIQEKVDTAMKDPTTRARVERSIKKNKDFEKRKEDTSAKATSTPRAEEKLSMVATTFSFSTSNSEIHLGSSWIMDSGSNPHICNSSMKGRYTKTRDATLYDFVSSGDGQIAIKSFGTIEIQGQCPDSITGKVIFELNNVAYVPNFLTNLVSMDIFAKKGVYYDGEEARLRKGNKTICKLQRKGGLYIVEDNTDNPQYRSFATTAKKQATPAHWHSILGHASSEAINRLEDSVEGVKLTQKDLRAPKIYECEPCALSKAHEIINRSSAKSEPSIRPFQRISFDLIHFSSAYNSDQWCSHIACYFSDFNIIWTHPKKSDAREVLRAAIALIKKRYNSEVVYIHTDGEKSLTFDFQKELTAEGITLETSTPYTPSQNGHAERKGGIITTKARTMRIAANLPTNIWPECMKTAAYIANLTPMQKHSWKTPFEMLHNRKPNLSHLRAFGCKAYPMIKTIPRKEKMAEKAHIGFLVGYDSTNVFRIWIPSKDKVIRTRDVIFDELTRYHPAEPDLIQLIHEPLFHSSLNTAELTEQLSQVTEISDSSVEDSLIPEETEQSRPIMPQKEQGNMDNQIIIPAVTDTPVSSNNLPTPAATPEPTLNSNQEAQQIEIVAIEELPQTEIQASNPQAIIPLNLAPRDITARLNIDNILPEGVPRIRKQSRKAAYTAQLEAAPYNIINFHASFSSFAAASSFYSQNKSEGRIHRDTIPQEPNGYREMIKHPHAQGFIQAINTEISALQAKQTWDEVLISHSLDAGKIPIPTRWVFKYKFDGEGYLTKYKARLCARGDLQKTHQDTFAATLAARVFRSLMAITAAFDLETRQYDAINAFANSPIDEPIYCHPPEGWKGKKDVKLLLRRALYGLKQAPALWYQHLSTKLVWLNLDPIAGVECLYQNEYMIVFFFVDDICVIYDKKNTAEVNSFEAKLFNAFEMRSLGEIQWFLGIKITRDRATNRLWLSQDSYIDKLVAKFNVSISKKVKTPLPLYECVVKATTQASPQEIVLYQQYVGSLNFAAVITRPDIAYTTSILAEHLTNPSQKHHELATRALHYLANTKHYALEFNPSNSSHHSVFIVSSDASYGDDPHTRQSTQGYVFSLYGAAIDWKANKQRTVTTSTTEAELLALSATAKEKMWWSRLFNAINFQIGHETAIQCDNMQTIRALTSKNPHLTTKLRHIDIHHHWLRQEVQQKSIKVSWTPSAKTLADGFTKALPTQRHEEFVEALGLVDKKQLDASKASNFSDHDAAMTGHEGGVSNCV